MYEAIKLFILSMDLISFLRAEALAAMTQRLNNVPWAPFSVIGKRSQTASVI